MSTATAKLLSDALQLEDKQDFVCEIIHRLPPWDSGPLNDDVAASVGDQLAAFHDDHEDRPSSMRASLSLLFLP
jgi:hypothetical protein